MPAEFYARRVGMKRRGAEVGHGLESVSKTAAIPALRSKGPEPLEVDQGGE
jgi:hypothetical protein